MTSGSIVVPEMTPERCAGLVTATVPLVMRHLRAEMRWRGALSLSVPQFRSLNYLQNHPGTSASELAEHLGVTRATASATIDRLVQNGLITRAEDPSSRRRVQLSITEMGKEQLQRAREQAEAMVAQLLKDLPANQLRQIGEGLVYLAEVFEQSADRRPA